MIHTFAERIGKGIRRRERMKGFSLTVLNSE
jgi:hypothetical protein